MKKFLFPLLLLCSLDLFSQTIYYVKLSGSDGNSGTSWATAFRTLQKALAVASGGQQIWVATGTYYPDEGPGQTGNSVASSFYLKSNVAVYGGFAGTETATAQRNLKTNVTTLSGDLGKNDTHPFGHYGDNANSVVRCYSITGAILDGVTITGGNGDGVGGGGVRNNMSSVTISNCRFIENSAEGSGGALNIYIGTVSVINCSFIRNRSTIGNGGAVYVSGDGDEFHNVWMANASFTNCTFVSNSAGEFGGGLIPYCQVDYGYYFDRAGVSYSTVQGGYGGTGNLDVDPLFVNVSADDYRLQFCSPAIEAGNTAGVTLPTDLDGSPRIIHPKVDMGAYESQYCHLKKTSSTNSFYFTGASAG